MPWGSQKESGPRKAELVKLHGVSSERGFRDRYAESPVPGSDPGLHCSAPHQPRHPTELLQAQGHASM